MVQNYLDIHALDLVCVRLLYCECATELSFLRKHEWPHHVFVKKGTPALPSDFTRVGRLLYSRVLSKIVPVKRAAAQNIVWLPDPKKRHDAEEPEWKLSCLPKPYFGDNRFVAKGVVLCRFVFKPQWDVPLYYGIRRGRGALFSGVTAKVLALKANRDALRFIRDRTNKSKDRATENVVEKKFNTEGLIKNRLVVKNNGCYTLTIRGGLLLAHGEKTV